MIGVPDGGVGGRHSLSTSPRSSAHSRDRHRAGSFHRSHGLPLHNIPSTVVLRKSIGADFLRPDDALTGFNLMHGIQYKIVLNIRGPIIQLLFIDKPAIIKCVGIDFQRDILWSCCGDKHNAVWKLCVPRRTFMEGLNGIPSRKTCVKQTKITWLSSGAWINCTSTVQIRDETYHPWTYLCCTRAPETVYKTLDGMNM